MTEEGIRSHIPAAHREAVNAIIRTVAAAHASGQFGPREREAVRRLDVESAHVRGLPPTVDTCRGLLQSIHRAHKQLGAPGDYGYESPEGAAMARLYRSTHNLSTIVKTLHPSRPATGNSQQATTP